MSDLELMLVDYEHPDDYEVGPDPIDDLYYCPVSSIHTVKNKDGSLIVIYSLKCSFHKYTLIRKFGKYIEYGKGHYKANDPTFISDIEALKAIRLVYGTRCVKSIQRSWVSNESIIRIHEYNDGLGEEFHPDTGIHYERVLNANAIINTRRTPAPFARCTNIIKGRSVCTL
jgi:predicted Rdx family selenoprotein